MPILDIHGNDMGWNLLRCESCNAVLKLRICEYCDTYGRKPGMSIFIGRKITESMIWDFYTGGVIMDYVKIFGRLYYIFHLLDFVDSTEDKFLTAENMPYSFKEAV